MVKINKLLLLSVITLTSYTSNAELIGSWSLNGHLQDSSGYAQHGGSFKTIDSLTNEATPETFVIDTVADQSLVYDFDNTNYIALNSSFNSLGALPEFSASAWFKTTGGIDNSNWALLDYDRSEYFNIDIGKTGYIIFSTSITLDTGGEELMI